MWSNTKSKAKTDKALVGLNYALKAFNSAVGTRKTSKQKVAKITRAGYGSVSSWYSLCAEVKERDGYKCVKCQAPESKIHCVYHEVHHIKPLSRGGTTTKANLILLCKDCHDDRHPHMKRKRA